MMQNRLPSLDKEIAGYKQTIRLNRRLLKEAAEERRKIIEWCEQNGVPVFYEGVAEKHGPNT